MNYNRSTIDRIGDLINGLHVETTGGILVAANFAGAANTQTELFNIYGRIGIMELFIELTAAADANATQVLFNCTFTTPVIAVNAMCAKCASIANLGAYGRIVYPGGAVATAAIITDSAGLTDVEMAGKKAILGGCSAAGVNTVGTIGMLASDATQAATIAATGHIFYVPMSPGAYVTAAL
ncbi:MAG: hypothetical protein GXY20_01560 [Clostridiales bacterium]|nr:hypothetical protein [Clostridiales bacterium]